MGERGHVFSVGRVTSGGRAQVNFSGKLEWLTPGDFVEAPAAEGGFRIFNRGVSAENPQRIGFDLIRP